MITYERCFTGKVNTYSCERTMKEYHYVCMFMVCLLQKEKVIEHQTVRSCILLSRSVRISLLQTELTAIVMEDFIHFLQAAVVSDLFSALYYDQEMLR